MRERGWLTTSRPTHHKPAVPSIPRFFAHIPADGLFRFPDKTGTRDYLAKLTVQSGS